MVNRADLNAFIVEEEDFTSAAPKKRLMLGYKDNPTLFITHNY